MVYYGQGMELEVISELFRGTVNHAVVCRDRLSAVGTQYLLLVIRDRACARKLLQIIEESERDTEGPFYLQQFMQNDEMVLVLPYRGTRKFTEFAKLQMTTQAVGEEICVNLAMECLSCNLPWPLLYLVLTQDCVQLSKDNSVYFTMALDLSKLDGKKDERVCVSCCAQFILDLLDRPVAGARRKKRKQLKSFELIRKKIGKNAYNGFPELYRDIKLTALPVRKKRIMERLKGVWARNKDTLFHVLLVLCCVVVILTLIMLVSQLIFGDIPLLRLFQNCFDVIGTENLHRGGR